MYDTLERQGYGANYNIIKIDRESSILYKRCYNQDGNIKIQNEIRFYEYIQVNHIAFPLPMLKNIDDDRLGYFMEYKQDYTPLFCIIYKLSSDKQQVLYTKILDHLYTLHRFTRIKISKEAYMEAIALEIKTKTMERYEKIREYVIPYDERIETVNHQSLLSFHELLDWLFAQIMLEIEKKKDFFHVLIHGDCQFNNILYNELTESIIFIDPRGYFGDSSLFGMSEYDIAKFLFALSGYDYFDSSNITDLSITDKNMRIDLRILDHDLIFKNKNRLVILLMLSIWLGNAHCFVHTVNKAITSYFIARYLGSYYYYYLIITNCDND